MIYLLVELLQQLIQDLQTQEPLENKLQLWTNTLYEFKQNQLQPQAISQPYYIMPSGMNTVGKIMAEGLNIQLNSRVESVTITTENNWQCHIESTDKNNPELPEIVTAKSLVIAIPAPQALMLLESSDIEFESIFLNQIKSVEYDPCITVMAGYSKEHNPDIPNWKAVTFSDDPILAWVGIDSSKRLHPTQAVFVIQSKFYFYLFFLSSSSSDYYTFSEI